MYGSQEERKRDRAKRKRAAQHKDKAKAQRQKVALAGKGFSTADVATVNAAKAAGKALTAGGGDQTKYSVSSDVFGAMQVCGVGGAPLQRVSVGVWESSAPGLWARVCSGERSRVCWGLHPGVLAFGRGLRVACGRLLDVLSRVFVLTVFRFPF